MCPSGVYISKWHFKINVGKKWFKSASKGAVQCAVGITYIVVVWRKHMKKCSNSSFDGFLHLLDGILCLCVCFSSIQQFQRLCNRFNLLLLPLLSQQRTNETASWQNGCSSSFVHTAHTHSDDDDDIRQCKPMQKTMAKRIGEKYRSTQTVLVWRCKYWRLTAHIRPEGAKCTFISTREKLNWISFQWKTYLPVFFSLSLSSVLAVERNSFFVPNMQRRNRVCPIYQCNGGRCTLPCCGTRSRTAAYAAI